MYRHIRQTHDWFVWLLIVCMVGASISPARGQANPSGDKAVVAPTKSKGQILMEEALDLYNQMEWEAAVVKLKEALDALRVELDTDRQVEAYWYLAVIARAQGDIQEAKDYMVKVFQKKSDFALPETLIGTDFETIYNDALARVDRIPPQITILSRREVQRDQPIQVTVEISDASPIARVELAYQLPGAEEVVVGDMTQRANNQWSGEIPGDVAGKTGELALRVSAWDSWQNPATQSETIVLPKQGGGHKVLYLVGGAIAAIGGGVAALLLSSGSPEAKEPTDNTNIDQTWPRSKPPLPPQ